MSLGDLPDSQMRKEAIMTSDHAFVWASAGTGKTHTLALRALYLLLNAPFLSHGNGEREGFLGPDCALYSAASRSERLKAARVTIRSLVLTTSWALGLRATGDSPGGQPRHFWVAEYA